MRAAIFVFLFAAGLAVPVAGAPLKVTDRDGSPAVEGSGSSATTISAAGGAVSVTIEGNGALDVHTHSGTISGSGALGVPQLGVELGGALADNEGASGAPGTGAEPANGASGAAVATGGGASAGDLNDVCPAAIPAESASVDAIGRVRNSRDVTIALRCTHESAIDVAQRQAIAENDVLVGALAAAGYEPDDVLQIQSDEQGAATLFVAAAD